MLIGLGASLDLPNKARSCHPDRFISRIWHSRPCYTQYLPRPNLSTIVFTDRKTAHELGALLAGWTGPTACCSNERKPQGCAEAACCRRQADGARQGMRSLLETHDRIICRIISSSHRASCSLTADMRAQDAQEACAGFTQNPYGLLQPACECMACKKFPGKCGLGVVCEVL